MKSDGTKLTEEQFRAFEEALTALCKEHDVGLRGLHGDCLEVFAAHNCYARNLVNGDDPGPE